MLNNFFKINNTLKVESGKILISEPLLDDYYFKRSIIVLTEHNEDGSVGFVINNPVDVKLNELIPDFPDFDANISIGGPVGTDTLQFIHSLGKKVKDSILIKPGLYWGGSFDSISELIKKNEISKNEILFFLGYSGWSPNQLNDEIKRDSWVVSELSSTSILSNNKNIWDEAITKLGTKQKIWTNFPSDPELN